ncbi:MAG: MBL fold metallo-hydrolase, partial [Treponema sp.]|nr:MBL fold metallo-hydrolase [Treponema sp.]
MKLFFHYCSFGFSNCYILGTDFSEGDSEQKAALREAIIIDPGNMDEQILDLIERNEYTLRGVLVTHDHLNHIHGLRTLERIYNVDIYAVNHVIQGRRTNLVKDGDVINTGAFSIKVISVPGHSSDSAV